MWRFLRFLSRFWKVFEPKNFKNGPILGCLWLFGAQKFMLFYALMIHETNHDDVFLLNSRSTFLNCSKLLKENYISILLWPNRNKNPAILWKNDRKWLNHANMWLFDIRSWKNSQAMFKKSIHRFWSGEFQSYSGESQYTRYWLDIWSNSHFWSISAIFDRSSLGSNSVIPISIGLLINFPRKSTCRV